MTTNEDLTAFVREALSRGVSRAQVEAALTQAGWDSRQIRVALDAFAPVDFPIPVPRPRISLSARDAFVYLLLFSTLYVVAYQFGKLIFQFINEAFPDPASAFADGLIRASVRFSVASLIVALPVFLYMSRLTNREATEDSGKRLSPIRRWLTYLTLFIAASVVIGDVTTLIYSALGGELTARFLLKVATVGLIAATVFLYYLSDLKVGEFGRRVDRINTRALGRVVTFLVVAAIAGGMFLLGSPLTERARRLDDRRVADLVAIARALDLYWTRTMRLPNSLGELGAETGAALSVTDPATGMPYEFRPLGGTNYELCAVFDDVSGEFGARTDVGFWTHVGGRQCFARGVEPVR